MIWMPSFFDLLVQRPAECKGDEIREIDSFDAKKVLITFKYF